MRARALLEHGAGHFGPLGGVDAGRLTSKPKGAHQLQLVGLGIAAIDFRPCAIAFPTRINHEPPKAFGSLARMERSFIANVDLTIKGDRI